MARHKRETPPFVFGFKLTLDPERDADLVAFIKAIPHGLHASAIKLALRQGIGPTRNGASEDDAAIEDALEELLL